MKTIEISKSYLDDPIFQSIIRMLGILNPEQQLTILDYKNPKSKIDQILIDSFFFNLCRIINQEERS